MILKNELRLQGNCIKGKTSNSGFQHERRKKRGVQNFWKILYFLENLSDPLYIMQRKMKLFDSIFH